MILTVLSVAFPFAPVGRGSVGGAEQILGALDAALVAGGHRSIVVACKGSTVAGKLLPVDTPRAPFDAEVRRQAIVGVQEAIDRAVHHYQIDLVHMHGFDFFEYGIPSYIPLLVTLHLPLCWYPARAWQGTHPHLHFQCVSEEQRNGWQDRRHEVFVVANGVQLPRIGETQPRQNFAVVMGRICPEKNAHEALEAATLRRMRVFIAGEVFPYAEHERYFAQKISPWLGRQRGDHRFLGPLAGEERWQLLSRAKCLLHPTLAPETSSLAAMEALAAGTPVIAYRSGALTGIVEHGVTGFLVNDRSEMADAIDHVGCLRSEACRRAAERRFSQQRMIREYFDLYEKLLHDTDAEKHCA